MLRFSQLPDGVEFVQDGFAAEKPLRSSSSLVSVTLVIYLDANATTPLHPEVLEAMLPFLSGSFANPSGISRASKAARKAIDNARGQVAELIGADAGEIVFTGGGTEAVNAALHSLDSLCGDGPVVTSAIEHSAVLRFAEALPRGLRKAPVDGEGRLLLPEFSHRCEGASFASVMWANNETGVIQPIVHAVAIAKEHGLPFHTDAIQAAGKIPLDVRAVAVDLLSLSAHKFHGPKGVGALFVRKGLRFAPLLRGGGQEDGRRSGTENVAGIVGMGAAAARMKRLLDADQHAQMQSLRDELEHRLLSEIDGVELNGSRELRLPNTAHVSFVGCEAAGLLVLLDDRNVVCSAGSACMTGKQQPSHVQKAMGFSDEKAKSSLRFGLSTLTTAEEIAAAVEAVKVSVKKLRSVQGGGGVGPVVVYTP